MQLALTQHDPKHLPGNLADRFPQEIDDAIDDVNSLRSRRRDLMLMVLTHNIVILLLALGFLQSTPGPFLRPNAQD